MATQANQPHPGRKVDPRRLSGTNSSTFVANSTADGENQLGSPSRLQIPATESVGTSALGASTMYATIAA
jgi:hypothetical protein